MPFSLWASNAITNPKNKLNSNLSDTLVNMHNSGTININPNLKDQLRAKAIKQRDFLKNSILTKDLINAAKTLKVPS